MISTMKSKPFLYQERGEDDDIIVLDGDELMSKPEFDLCHGNGSMTDR